MFYFAFIHRPALRRVDRLWRGLIVTLVLVVFGMGCQGQCQGPVASTDPSALAAHAPLDTPFLVFAPTLEALVTSLDTALSELPFSEDIGHSREALKEGLGFDPLDGEALARLGLDRKEPALGFIWGGQIIVAASASEPKTFMTSLAGFEGQGLDLSAREVQKFRVLGSDLIALAHRRGRVLMSIPLIRGKSRDATEALVALIELDEKERWGGYQNHADFLRGLDDAPLLHGFVDPTPWLRRREADGHARLVLERLTRQVGLIHFAAHHHSAARKLRISVYTPGEAAQPVVIAGLGNAEGKLPQVGGLVRPGVLGVVRVSADPEALYNLFRSTLPAEQRLGLEGFWNELDEELKLDVRNNVIRNFEGHFLAVIYGFQERVLQADNPTMLDDLFKLKATREAVLIPIKDRNALEPILDVATQISRGHLRRQVIRHTIQYAWIPDGSLEWALILHDDYLLFVDSAVAFDHAIAWERSPRSLSDSLKEVGLDRILEEKRSGFYVDLTTLSNLLAENGQKTPAAWMRPFDTLVFSTDEKHAQIELIYHRD